MFVCVSHSSQRESVAICSCAILLLWCVVLCRLCLCQGEILFGHLLMRLLLIPHEALMALPHSYTSTHTYSVSHVHVHAKVNGNKTPLLVAWSLPRFYYAYYNLLYACDSCSSCSYSCLPELLWIHYCAFLSWHCNFLIAVERGVKELHAKWRVQARNVGREGERPNEN